MTVNLELNHKSRKDGLRCILIRVTQNKKHTRVTSEIYIKKSQWKEPLKWGKWIRETHPEADKLNRELEDKIRKIQDHYKDHGVINPTAAINGSDFFKYAEEFIEQYDNENNQGTYDTYNSKLNKLERYLGKRELPFEQIDVPFIRKYIIHLKEQGNKINTIGTDLKKIRAIIGDAVRQEVIDYAKNPFLRIKIDYERTSKAKLTKQDLDKIRRVKLKKGGYLWHARNIFLFQINCMGERIGAILKLKQENLHRKSLHYLKGKGSKSKNVDLLPEAVKILSYYPRNTTYLFPYLEGCKSEYVQVKSSTALINRALKVIATKAKVNKKISTHVARHTLTKLLIDGGIDMRTLQGILDHSTIAITEHYAGDIADKSGNAAIKKVLG